MKETTDEKQEKKVGKTNGVIENKADTEEKENKAEKEREESWEVLSNETNGMSKKTQ